MEKVDLAIVGAGAAGLMAAWSAVRTAEGSGLSVRLFERREKSGRKLLAAGNGRCNLGHSGPLAGHYRGQDPNFVLPVFTLVPEEDYRRIFLDLGVPLLEDEADFIHELCWIRLVMLCLMLYCEIGQNRSGWCLRNPARYKH